MLSALAITASAADKDAEGMAYFLPKTAMKVKLLVEKTTFKPGQLAQYSSLYFKNEAKTEADVNYRILGISMSAEGVPDSSKMFRVLIDKRHSILNVDCGRNGVLKAINAKGLDVEEPAPFKPAPKPAPLDPHDYMSQEILSSGNLPKMARMVAQEIYDIRDSRNQLSRGEADFMPKDGEQLKLMLAQLRTQETALLQMFEGTAVKDTSEVDFDFVPQRGVQRSLLFRFSKKFGVVDADDLSGRPFYAEVADQHVLAELPAEANVQKRSKDDLVLGVNMPGKIKVAVADGERKVAEADVYAAQFGRVEILDGSLFGKKITSHLVIDPVTGSIVSLKTEPLE